MERDLRYFFSILLVFTCLANMAKADICDNLIEVNSIYDKVFQETASSKDVRKLQKYVGAAQDGRWGPKSDAAYARLLRECDSVKSRPTKLLLDIVRQRRSAESLSDTELCESLKYVDLESTYYEMKKRNLDCLSISKKSVQWREPASVDAYRFLREYQRRYNVKVPDFDVTLVKLKFPPPEKSLPLYHALNPNFIASANRPARLEDFCLEWFPQVATIIENQTKNLDGSVGWSEGTLTGAFVDCEEVFAQLAYRALINNETKQRLQKAIEGWIENNTPNREQQNEFSSFSYTLFVNRVLIVLELLHTEFDWDENDYQAASRWIKERALELLPGDKEQRWGKLAYKCKLEHKSNKTRTEVCRNGGIYQAQALLRAGIFTQDKELVEIAFLAFHRFMSGVRQDGSNADDSARGCTAAGYQIWGSQFLNDFVHLWSTIGDQLWEHRSFGRGTPAASVEYSLSLFNNWEKINNYTLDEEWRGCGSNHETRLQLARTQPNLAKYNKASFAAYFHQQDFDTLVTLLTEEYDRREIASYVLQSGIAYEVSLLHRNPLLLEKVLANKKKELQTYQYLKDLSNGEVPIKLFPNLGVGLTAKAEYVLLDPTLVDIGDYRLLNKVIPESGSKSTKYRVKLYRSRASESPTANKKVVLSNKTITIYAKGSQSNTQKHVSMYLGDIFDVYPDMQKAWEKVWNKCAIDDLPLDDIELPISGNEWLAPIIPCIDENIDHQRLTLLIRILLQAGLEIDISALK